jgi:hypothetical protein
MELMRPLAAAALAALAACATGPGRAPVMRPPPDPAVLAHIKDAFRQYVNALLLLNHEEPSDWERAFRELDTLHPYMVAADERAAGETPGLIDRAKRGDAVARRELGRRGRIYNALLTFWRPFTPDSRDAWNAARAEISRQSVDHDGESYLAMVLCFMLINGQFRIAWPEVRFQLVELGDSGFETVLGLAERKVAEAPVTVIFKEEDLVQLFTALIGYGDRGWKPLRGYARHAKWTVRKAAARAIGEARGIGMLPELGSLLREEMDDGSWMVRAAAAETARRFDTPAARPILGPLILESVKTERNPIVKERLIDSLGEIHFVDAVPTLINALDLPNSDHVMAAMRSLYHITAEKELVRPEHWKEWYAKEYAAWRARQR